MSEERSKGRSSRDHRDRDREHRHRDEHRSRHHHHRSHRHRSDRHEGSRDEKDRHRESNRHRDSGYRDRESKYEKRDNSASADGDEYEWVESVNVEDNLNTNEEPSSQQVTQTQLNEMNAKILKAKLRKSSDVNDLEIEYEKMKENFYGKQKQGEDIQRQNDALSLKRNYGDSAINQDEMTIQDMVREEKSSSGLGKSSIQSIIKDKKYSNDLDYQDDYSNKLAEYVQKGSIDLKNMEASQAKKLASVLDRCQLCIENDNCCDILSMADKVYLTLPPDPSIAKYSTMIVPINHSQNTIQCDEDEWDEIRNYMISLSKFYYTKLNKSVIFYETSIYKHNHAAIIAVPIPNDIIIYNPRYSIAKEAPYFHVWFNLNGGLGHIVEDVGSWPKGDLFAREVIGGVLNVDPYIIRKQGKWTKNDERVHEMSKIWRQFDWTEGR
ncbi:unnamed protein product [Wickerhamomyces anomalus]